jgi:hypothetical protein
MPLLLIGIFHPLSINFLILSEGESESHSQLLSFRQPTVLYIYFFWWLTRKLAWFNYDGAGQANGSRRHGCVCLLHLSYGWVSESVVLFRSHENKRGRHDGLRSIKRRAKGTLWPCRDRQAINIQMEESLELWRFDLAEGRHAPIFDDIRILLFGSAPYFHYNISLYLLQHCCRFCKSILSSIQQANAIRYPGM